MNTSHVPGPNRVPDDLGWIDTSVLVHALFPNDPHHRRCDSILRGLERGELRGRIDPIVVHELSYVLLRIPHFSGRQDVHTYLRSILLMNGVGMDAKARMLDAISLWARSGVGFADAWLSCLAGRGGTSVCSVNRRDFPGLHNTYPLSD